MHTITPHVVVRDATRAVDWYTRVLGAEEQLRIPVPDGRLMSVELRFGDSTVMLADEFPELGIVSPQTLGGTYMALHLLVDDVDTVWQRTLEEGAEVFRPLQDSFWGERQGQVIDPFGHRWSLANASGARGSAPAPIWLVAVTAFWKKSAPTAAEQRRRHPAQGSPPTAQPGSPRPRTRTH